MEVLIFFPEKLNNVANLPLYQGKFIISKNNIGTPEINEFFLTLALGASYGMATKSPISSEAAAFEGGSSTLPIQIHHFATNKHSVWTPKMDAIAKQFGLDLGGAWNKSAMPHSRRHPNVYHQFVYEGMKKSAAGAGGNQAKFLQIFDEYVKQPVLQNPSLLRKSGWQNEELLFVKLESYASIGKRNCTK